ncbi:MAG: DUF2784 domain-containing protein [Thermodesulfobacteriota bacterium]
MHLYRVMADGVLLIHFSFVLFVVAGGLLVYNLPKLARVHLPCVAWGALVEFSGWPCPLTPLENYLRNRGAAGCYEESFIEHYFIPILYPQLLTPGIQIALGIILLGVNALIYGWIWYRYAKCRT